jgi:hypothetical protein
MRASGEKRVQPRSGARDRVGAGDADGVEAMRLRGGPEGVLDRGGFVQKSRSA